MSLPRKNKHLVSSHLATLVCCFIFAAVFAGSKPEAHAVDLAKDAQQDEHLVAIDARMDQKDKDRDRISASRDAQIALLQKEHEDEQKDEQKDHEEEQKANADVAKQQANDEGKAQGAFIFIGLLAGSGVFIQFKARKA